MDRRWALLLLATQVRGELDKDGEKHVSPRIDPLSSSFYFDIQRKVKPIVEKASACDQAKWATGLVACGIFEMVVGRWAMSALVKRASAGQYQSMGAFLRRKQAHKEASEEIGTSGNAQNEAQKEPLPEVVGIFASEDEPLGSRSAVIGSSMLGLATVAAILVRQRARRGRSGTKGGYPFSTVVACDGKELDEARIDELVRMKERKHPQTPEKRPRSVLRPSKALDGKAESSDSDDINSESEKEASRLPGRLGMGMGRQLTEPAKLGTPRGEANSDGPRWGRRVSSGAEWSQSLPITPRGAREGGATGAVEYGDGFVRQRTLEYERKIDFHRIYTDKSAVSDGKDWNEEYPEYNMGLQASFFRLDTQG